DPDARRADARSVDELVAARADHGAHGRRPDDLAEPEGPEPGREHLGVRGTPPVLEHDLRPEVPGKRPRGRLSAARLPNLIGALAEDGEELLLDVPAAIPALVDHEPFLVPEFPEILPEPGQRGLVHRLDVEVADPSARELVHHRAAVLDPALV